MIALLLLSVALAGPAREAEWGPWDGRWAPVEGVHAAPAAHRPARSGLLEWAYRSYRRASRPGVATCPYYPTCSGYGILAVRAHGPILGGLLTVDRLLREHPWLERLGPDTYPVVNPHGPPRLYDPVHLHDGIR